MAGLFLMVRMMKRLFDDLCGYYATDNTHFTLEYLLESVRHVDKIE